MGVQIASGARRLLGLLGLTASVGANSAMAQELRLEGATQREKQQLEETGIRSGAFDIRPEFGASAIASDNVFYSDTNRRSDVSLETRAALGFKSLFARHELRADIWVNRVSYAKFTGEDVTNYGGEASGRIDVSRDTTVELRAGYDHLSESRSSLNANRGTDKRASFSVPRASIAIDKKFNNFSVRLGGRIADYRYSEVLVAGVDVPQRNRDFRVYEGTADLVYGLRDPTRLVLHASVEQREYDIGFGDALFDSTKFIDRSAKGLRVEVGVQREITDLIRGTIRVGYLQQNYVDPRIVDFKAFSYHGDIVWNVTPLTSLVVTADRRVDETVSPFSPGNLRDTFSLAFQHELLRSVVLFGDARYSRVKLLETTTRSNEIDLGFGASYYLGNHLVLTGEARHTQRHSGVAPIDFDANIFSLSVKYRF